MSTSDLSKLYREETGTTVKNMKALWRITIRWKGIGLCAIEREGEAPITENGTVIHCAGSVAVLGRPVALYSSQMQAEEEGRMSDCRGDGGEADDLGAGTEAGGGGEGLDDDNVGGLESLAAERLLETGA